MVHFRIVLCALALLVCTAASAAMKIGPPKTMRTVASRPANADSIAILAAGGYRVALWSEGTRMFVGLADRDWKIDEATIVALPSWPGDPLQQSLRPGITFNGSYFLLDWYERRMYAMGSDWFERIAIRWSPTEGLLDRELTYLDRSNANRPLPDIIWNGKEFVVITDIGASTLERSTLTEVVLAPALDSLAAATVGPGKPIFIFGRFLGFIACPAGACDNYWVEPLLLDTGRRQLSGFGSPNRLVTAATIAAASASERTYLAAWRDQQVLHVGAFDASVRQFGRSSITTQAGSEGRMRMTWDGKQHMLVWMDASATGRATVNATLFATDATQLGETVTLATDAVYPSVTELGRGQYAVAYFSGRDLIVREVTTVEPGRTRAIR